MFCLSVFLHSWMALELKWDKYYLMGLFEGTVILTAQEALILHVVIQYVRIKQPGQIHTEPEASFLKAIWQSCLSKKWKSLQKSSIHRYGSLPFFFFFKASYVWKFNAWLYSVAICFIRVDGSTDLIIDMKAWLLFLRAFCDDFSGVNYINHSKTLLEKLARICSTADI